MALQRLPIMIPSTGASCHCIQLPTAATAAAAAACCPPATTALRPACCRSPTEVVWPATRHQQRCERGLAARVAACCSLLDATGTSIRSAATLCTRAPLPPPCALCLRAVASRLHTALTTALLSNDALREALVTRLGFAVKVLATGY